LPDEKFLVAGNEHLENGVRRALLRLNSDGTIDPTFVQPAFGANGNYISPMEALPDGRIRLLGMFTEYNSVPVKLG
jgi:hypothetical protein